MGSFLIIFMLLVVNYKILKILYFNNKVKKLLKTNTFEVNGEVFTIGKDIFFQNLYFYKYFNERGEYKIIDLQFIVRYGYNFFWCDYGKEFPESKFKFESSTHNKVLTKHLEIINDTIIDRLQPMVNEHMIDRYIKKRLSKNEQDTDEFNKLMSKK